MEKTLSVEEKIRRAEEIYNRRNGYVYTNNKPKKGHSLMYRMIKQIVICFIIYGMFYVVNNREYFLSQEFKEKVQTISEKNEKLNNIYNLIMPHIEKYFYRDNEGSNTQNQTEEEQSSNKNIENDNIGGAEEFDILQENNTNEQNTEKEKTQEEKDVEEIKNTISFINPIEGTISSTFGWRTPTTKTVPKYHTGLDIAQTEGTIIKSSTDGTVILASNEGDYGKHYKIQINDVTVIYAHCSKLYLQEGDKVTQGQEIAEVGSTGNSTRTTFTF